jgi:hypothetical protein
MVAGILVLTAVLLAGCGGGDDHAKVEASLQQYLVGLPLESNPFPVGAGTPRVKDNGCKDRHLKIERGRVLAAGPGIVKFGQDVAIWGCVVKVGKVVLPVGVAVDASTEVVAVSPGEYKPFKPK